MKSLRSFLFLAILVLSIGVLIFFRATLLGFLGNAGVALGNIFHPPLVSSIESLQAENEILKAKFQAEESGFANEFSGSRFSYIFADVASRYPFSDRNIFIINKGEGDGVRVGMPVLVTPGIIAGKVSAIKRTQSEVQTIFDPDWRSSVLIGTSSVKGVLHGGISPKVEFIPKDADIALGDIVTNLSSDLPLHFSVGTVEKIEHDSADTWLVATLSPSYIFESIRHVSLITNFP